MGLFASYNEELLFVKYTFMVDDGWFYWKGTWAIAVLRGSQLLK